MYAFKQSQLKQRTVILLFTRTSL